MVLEMYSEWMEFVALYEVTSGLSIVIKQVELDKSSNKLV
jgi:hypothetical protein